MKILGWILFLAVNNVHAQQVIEPAPLSVEDDGTRKIITNGPGKSSAKVEDKTQIVVPPAAAEIVIPNDEVLNPTTKPAPVVKTKTTKTSAKVKPVEVIDPIGTISPVNMNPKDGQLKLEDKSAAPIPTTNATTVIIENKTEVQVVDVDPTSLFESYDSRLGKYLQFSFGYINSRYEKIHSNLDNGSSQTAFKFVSDLNSRVQTGFAIEVLSDTSGQSIPDNIRVIQYRLFGDYHAPLIRLGSTRFDWVAGLSFSVGKYGIKRRYVNTQGEEVSVKIKSGTIVGLIPAGGIRIYLVGQSSFDLMLEYHQYFGNPQKYIGGLAISPRLSFQF
jgi:hypothetical protein